MYLFLLPTYVPVLISTNELRFVSANHIARLRGSLVAQAWQMLPLLQQGVTREELLAAFISIERPRAAAALQILIGRGFVGEGDRLDEMGKGFQPYRPLLRLPSVVDTAQALTKGVMVIGTGPVADVAVRLLAEASVRIIPPMSGEDDITSPNHLQDVMRNAGAVLFCPKSPFDPRHSTVNQAALATKVPLVRGLVCQQFAIVGPTVIPFETACLSCYLERSKLSSSDNEIDDVAAVLASDPLRAQQFCTTGLAVSTLAGSMLAWETLRVLCMPMETVTAGALWIFDAITARVRMQRVLRAPRCIACGVWTTPKSNVWELIDAPENVELG